MLNLRSSQNPPAFACLLSQFMTCLFVCIWWRSSQLNNVVVYMHGVLHVAECVAALAGAVACDAFLLSVLQICVFRVCMPFSVLCRFAYKTFASIQSFPEHACICLGLCMK